jgi:hypothetical protein
VDIQARPVRQYYLAKAPGGSDQDGIYSIQQTDDGGFIVAGYSSSSNSGTLTGIPGHGTDPNLDCWILKLDSAGETIWQKLLGGTLSDVGNCIRLTQDGGYIAFGRSQSSDGDLSELTNNGLSDWWVIKLNSAGEIQWQKLLGGEGSDIPGQIRETVDGGYILAGIIDDSQNTGTLTGLTSYGSYDIWVVKMDSSGNLEWQNLYGGNGLELFRWIEVTSDGGFIIASDSNSSNSGTLAGLTSNGGQDILLLKLDFTGNTQWVKLYGGLSIDYAISLCQTHSGEYMIAGCTLSSNSGTLTGVTNYGGFDIWIFKVDNKGNVLK